MSLCRESYLVVRVYSTLCVTIAWKLELFRLLIGQHRFMPIQLLRLMLKFMCWHDAILEECEEFDKEQPEDISCTSILLWGGNPLEMVADTLLWSRTISPLQQWFQCCSLEYYLCYHRRSSPPHLYPLYLVWRLTSNVHWETVPTVSSIFLGYKWLYRSSSIVSQHRTMVTGMKFCSNGHSILFWILLTAMTGRLINVFVQNC